MKKWFIVLFIISIFLISGCSPKAPVITCDKPYVVINGKCCLDANNNNACDDQEQVQPKTEQQQKNTVINNEPQEPIKVEAGNKIRLTPDQLPASLQMQANTRILYALNEQDEVYTINSVQDTQVTIFYGKDRFIIKKGNAGDIGPLSIILSGIYPPKGGNFAIIKIDKLNRLTEDQITALFGASDKAINIPTSIVKVQQGQETNLRIMMRNILGAPHTFTYTVALDEGTAPPNSVNWHKQEINLKSGEGFEDFITFNTKNYPLGSYRFRVTLACNDCTPSEQDSAPIILEVAAK